MNEMWEALERYQPYADKHGFGPQWLKMTTERTAEAARAAWAAGVARAAWAAEAAAWAAEEAKAEDAAAAIRYINEAIALEETK